jgi:hypothetical protein
MEVREILPTFYTNDTTWCLVYPWSMNDDNELDIEDPQSLVGTGRTLDKECESIINILWVLNTLKWHTAKVFTSRRNDLGITSTQDFFGTATEPPDIALPWISFDEISNRLLVPLQTRVLPKMFWAILQTNGKQVM